MKLITEDFKSLMVKYPFGSQDVSDPLVLAKFFNPCGAQTWLITEYEPESNCAFGYVMGMDCDELGYISMDELQTVKLCVPGMTIERDLYFNQNKLSHFKAGGN